MKTKLILVSFLFSTYIAECQQKPFAISKIDNLKVKGLNCIDSANRISTQCSLGMDGFSVKFYYADFDNTKKVLRLIGRVCIGEGSNSIGVSNIVIFKGVKNKNEISKKEVLGGSTYDKKFISNDGFFDISYSIRSMESLFFQGTGYYLKEFVTFKILK